MLDIQMEPRRGILFIRLSGDLNRNNINKINDDVLKFIREIGIKNIVFNLNEVSTIDKYGENALTKSMNTCLSNKGKMLICVSDKKKIYPKLKNRFKKVKIVKDELNAISLINS